MSKTAFGEGTAGLESGVHNSSLVVVLFGGFSSGCRELGVCCTTAHVAVWRRARLRF